MQEKVPTLAGDWSGQTGFQIESRFRGYGAVVTSPADARVLECLVRWRLLTRRQIESLVGLGTRQESLERLFRIGLVDRVVVQGLSAYTLSPYARQKLGVAWPEWTALRALKILAANRVGEVLVRAYGGSWEVEPDRARAARWEADGQRYGVYVYRYWPGSDGEALAVLQAVRERTLVIVPVQADASRLAAAAGIMAEWVRWTWDHEVTAGKEVRFWAWSGSGLVPAEVVSVTAAD